MTRRIILAITGASGAIYAVRLLDALLAAGRSVDLSISPAGAAVLEQELGLSIDLATFDPRLLVPTRREVAAAGRFARIGELMGDNAWLIDPATAADDPRTQIHYCHYQDLLAPMASGSALAGGMVVCPCSGGTASAIAHAASGNLIHRAADVQLKEGRKLILVPRETPLSTIQLENLRLCAAAGAVVLPAMPGWYHGVRSLRDLVDFVVARICDQLQVEHSLVRRWGE